MVLRYRNWNGRIRLGSKDLDCGLGLANRFRIWGLEPGIGNFDGRLVPSSLNGGSGLVIMIIGISVKNLEMEIRVYY